MISARLHPFRTSLLLAILSLPLSLACAQPKPAAQGAASASPSASAPASVRAESARTVDSERGPLRVEVIASGLSHPWGLAFLPDGDLLVSERNSGKLYRIAASGGAPQPLAGTPEVVARGQGGLMDVALHPNFESNGLVYLSYAAPGENGTASTALGRGKLVGDRLEGFQRIFLQTPAVRGGNHFGNRIVFAPNGSLFLVLGERFGFQPAQDLSSHLGKIVCLNDDGSPFAENPFRDQPGALPEIWSYGHRNIEAAAIHPQTGALWIGEMGPKGGDELNLIEPGQNYGWPLVSWGNNYDGSPIPDPTTRPDLRDAVKHWTPVISPSGMVFASGQLFPDWTGNLLIGGLTTGELVRLTMDGQQVTGEERITIGERVRDVDEAPDGSIYLLTDASNGSVLRLTPTSR
jgi:glucose/arabinose dehydrogenase